MTVAGRIAWAVVMSLVALSTASCSSDGESDAEARHTAWAQATLPVPPGPAGQVTVRDAVWCDGRWYAVGGVLFDEPTESQDTRPAAWTSSDGESWTSVAIEADTYYGSRAILYTVACRDDLLAALGTRAGGAHGFPRFSTFGFDEDGVLEDEQPLSAVFVGPSWSSIGSLYGGDEWLVSGNRINGPAVWLSDDARTFEAIEGAPQLATDDGWRTTVASGATWTDAGWVVVGSGVPPREHDNASVAWTSPDGRAWTRTIIDDGGGYRSAQRVIQVDDDLMAVGVAGNGFRAWRRHAGKWQTGQAFGVQGDAPVGAPTSAARVVSLASTPSGVIASVSDGVDYQVWRSDDGDEWVKVSAPPLPDLRAGTPVVVGGGAGPLIVGSGADGNEISRLVSAE